MKKKTINKNKKKLLLMNNSKSIFLYSLFIFILFIFIILINYDFTKYYYLDENNIIGIFHEDIDDDIYMETIINLNDFQILCNAELIVYDENNNSYLKKNQSLIIEAYKNDTFNISYKHSIIDSNIIITRECKDYDNKKSILRKIINIDNIRNYNLTITNIRSDDSFC
jgi:hypothetical protein